MKTVVTLIGKECSLFLRDRSAVVLTFVVPFVLIYIMGSIFGGGGGGGPNARAKIAALSLSDSPAAARLLEGLRNEESLDVVVYPDGGDAALPIADEAALRQGIVDRRYNFALLIPADFLEAKDFGLRLKLFYNPVNEIETQMVNGLLQKAIFAELPFILSGKFDQIAIEAAGGPDAYEAYLDQLARLASETFGGDYEKTRESMSLADLAGFLDTDGRDEATASGDDAQGEGASPGARQFLEELVQVEKDQVYGAEVENPQLTRVVGGYAVMFLLFAVTGSATSLFEERAGGIFARLLSLPARRSHILWSKYLFNTLLGVAQTQAMFLCAALLFGMDIFSNYGALLVVSILVASACAAFGMLLASIAKTQAQAQGMGTLLILTMASLGGAWWPISFMPEFLQAIGRCTIVYWGVEGFLAALWARLPLGGFLPTLGVIAAFAIGLNAISLWRFRSSDLFR